MTTPARDFLTVCALLAMCCSLMFLPGCEPAEELPWRYPADSEDDCFDSCTDSGAFGSHWHSEDATCHCGYGNGPIACFEGNSVEVPCDAPADPQP